MTVDFPLVIGGLLVGTIVGLTGMGGGALMTPMLVFFFGVDPLTAISSDIVVSLLMKPVGAAVHLRRGTVNLRLVAWLCVGSVPAAFAGAWVISLVPPDADLNGWLKRGLGIALLIATAGLIARALLQMWRYHLPLGEGVAGVPRRPAVVPRPLPTLLLGAGAGFMVGPDLGGRGLDRGRGPAHAPPGAAGLGPRWDRPRPGDPDGRLGGGRAPRVRQLLDRGGVVAADRGDPGAWIGAQASTRAPGGIIRRVLAVVLLASGLKLLGVSNELVLAAAVAALVGGSLFWMLVRRRIRRGRLEARARSAATPSPDAAGAAIAPSVREPDLDVVTADVREAPG